MKMLNEIAKPAGSLLTLCTLFKYFFKFVTLIYKKKSKSKADCKRLIIVANFILFFVSK